MKLNNNMGKRIGAVMNCIIILVTLASPVFSAAATVEAFDLFGALYSAYLVAHGLDPEFTNNGVLATTEEPISETSWRFIWEENFNYYAPLVDDTIESAVDWVEGYLQDLRVEKIFKNGSNTPPPSPDPNNSGVIGFQFTAQLSEFFDKLTNLILKDKYNLTPTESGFSHSSGSFADPLTSYNSKNWALIPLYNGVWNGSEYYVKNTNNDVYYYSLNGERLVYGFVAGNTLYLVGSTSAYTWKSYSGPNSYSSSGLNNTDSVTKLKYANIVFNDGISETTFPEYNTMRDGFDDPGSTDTLLLKPKGKYTTNPIPVPDTDDQDYLPVPQRIPLNIPYPESDAEPDFSDLSDPDINDFIQPVIKTATENGLESPDPIITPEAPSSVMPPFLPTNVPPFNFSLSGIWYYVMRWIGSIRSGTSFIFTIFNNIPAAMFFPIFGTAVAVIVIGVWKRFFT